MKYKNNIPWVVILGGGMLLLWGVGVSSGVVGDLEPSREEWSMQIGQTAGCCKGVEPQWQCGRTPITCETKQCWDEETEWWYDCGCDAPYESTECEDINELDLTGSPGDYSNSPTPCDNGSYTKWYCYVDTSNECYKGQPFTFSCGDQSFLSACEE